MEYFVLKDGQRLGPYTRSELKDRLADGTLCPADRAWCIGRPDWKPIKGIVTRKTPARGFDARFVALAILIALVPLSLYLLANRRAPRIGLSPSAWERTSRESAPPPGSGVSENVPKELDADELQPGRLADAETSKTADMSARAIVENAAETERKRREAIEGLSVFEGTDKPTSAALSAPEEQAESPANASAAAAPPKPTAPADPKKQAVRAEIDTVIRTIKSTSGANRSDSLRSMVASVRVVNSDPGPAEISLEYLFFSRPASGMGRSIFDRGEVPVKIGGGESENIVVTSRAVTEGTETENGKRKVTGESIEGCIVRLRAGEAFVASKGSNSILEGIASDPSMLESYLRPEGE